MGKEVHCPPQVTGGGRRGPAGPGLEGEIPADADADGAEPGGWGGRLGLEEEVRMESDLSIVRGTWPLPKEPLSRDSTPEIQPFES